MQRREHVFIRLDVIERYLAELARFHADAGRPAHVAGVRSAMAKIKREVARSECAGESALNGAKPANVAFGALPVFTGEQTSHTVNASSAARTRNPV